MSVLLKRLESERRAIRMCLLIAATLVVLAIAEFIPPAPTTFTGRWGWGLLRRFMFVHFGETGLAATWIALAVLPLTFARLLWRHANRIPSDRCYRN